MEEYQDGLDKYNDVIEKTTESIVKHTEQLGMIKMLMQVAGMVQKEVGENNKAVVDACVTIDAMCEEHEKTIAYNTKLQEVAVLGKKLLVEITEKKD